MAENGSGKGILGLGSKGLSQRDIERHHRQGAELRELLHGYLAHIERDGRRIAGSGMLCGWANSALGMVTSSTWGAREQAKGLLDYIAQRRCGEPQYGDRVYTDDHWVFALDDDTAFSHTCVFADTPEGYRYRLDPRDGAVTDAGSTPARYSSGGVRG